MLGRKAFPDTREREGSKDSPVLLAERRSSFPEHGRQHETPPPNTPLDDGLLGTRFDEERSETR